MQILTPDLETRMSIEGYDVKKYRETACKYFKSFFENQQFCVF